MIEDGARQVAAFDRECLSLRPSKRAVFDSVSRTDGDDASRVEHIARAVTHRVELARYRDSISAKSAALLDSLERRYLIAVTPASEPEDRSR